MGSSNSVFSSHELQVYEDLTGLNAAEINHAYKRFKQIDPLAGFSKEDRKGRISYMFVADGLKELKVNPFRFRICKLFCSSKDGFMNFNDFLDMVSVLSAKGDKHRMVAWAFKLYDFNEDGFLDGADMDTLMDILTDHAMPQKVKDDMITKVLENADRDGDEAISFEEFQRHLYFNPEFYETFRFTL